MANPLGSMGGLSVVPVNIGLLKRLIERRCVHEGNGCLTWPGWCLKGYPQGKVCGKSRLLHRALYIGVYGSIPPGMQVDHSCDNSRCLNIYHLEAKTPRANALRSNNPCAQHSRQEKCVHGHEFDKQRIDNKGRISRVCSTCKSERARRPKLCEK